MTAEQRAEVRLTDDEREALGWMVNGWPGSFAFRYQQGEMSSDGIKRELFAAVERILADRAAAEDHGLRARVTALADKWDRAASMAASYPLATWVNELRAALDGEQA